MNTLSLGTITPLSQLLHIQRAPNTVVACINDEPILFAQWQQAVQHLAAIYAQQASTRYLLWCQSSYHFSVQLFALWYARKTVVLPPNVQPENLARYASSIDAVVTDIAAPESIFSTINKSIYATNLSLAHLEKCDRQASTFNIEREAISLILFTSGSGGEPKAVSRTLAQLESELAALHAQFVTPSQLANTSAAATSTPSVIIGAVPHHHIYGLLFRLLWPLAEAWPFVNETHDYPEPLLACLQKHRRVTFIASPAQLSRFPDRYDWSCFRQHVWRIFSSGAPLASVTAQLLYHATANAPIEVLGSTETGGVAYRQRQGVEAHWQVLPGVEYRVDEAELLYVRSPAASVFDWYALGDRATRHDDGSFSLLGRADRIVKVEGKRLSLQEMEKQLLLCPEIQSCALTVCYHNRDIVASVIVLSALGESALNTLGRKKLGERFRAHLLPHFERILLPRWFRYVAHLPVDERGKLTQKNLQKLFSAQESE